MTAFENATKFFHACESLEGWEGCAPYAASGATFAAQSNALADIDTAEGYAEWMKAVGTGPLEGCSYDLHCAAYDDAARMATFFATFHGTHGGDGGPMPPTGKSSASHYVYVLTMDDSDQVAHMTKIWHDGWALAELGWA